MKENKDQLEQIIKSEYDRIAQEEEDNIQNDDSITMPEGAKDAIRVKLDEQIEVIEKEKIYSRLSEEDREALELGRKVQEERAAEAATVKIVRRKKRLKAYIGLAAVLVIVLGAGVTSMGGPERVVRWVKQMVGNREVVQVDSSEDNKMIVEENEEEAYQEVSEVFGVEPVRIVYTEEMKFRRMEFDKEFQIAELYYEYSGEVVAYLINASYKNTSWGMDIEDNVTNSYTRNVKGCRINIKEYMTSDSGTERFSASFKYQGLEYYLFGTMEREDFDAILNNLFFVK